MMNCTTMNGCGMMCVGMAIGGLLVLAILILLTIWLVKQIRRR